MRDRHTYRLVPGWTDVDQPGWEITSTTDDQALSTCHVLFSNDAAEDDTQAQAWADDVIGTRQQWRRVEENAAGGHYHFVSC